MAIIFPTGSFPLYILVNLYNLHPLSAAPLLSSQAPPDLILVLIVLFFVSLLLLILHLIILSRLFLLLNTRIWSS
jgi:hypothetical protein